MASLLDLPLVKLSQQEAADLFNADPRWIDPDDGFAVVRWAGDVDGERDIACTQAQAADPLPGWRHFQLREVQLQVKVELPDAVDLIEHPLPLAVDDDLPVAPSDRFTSTALRDLDSPPWRVVYEIADDRLGDLLALAHEVRMRYQGPEVEVEGTMGQAPGAMHLVRWPAIRAAHAEGCPAIELGGVDLPGHRRPPQPGEPNRGLYEHKRGFGAEWVEREPARRIVLRPGAERLALVRRRVIDGLRGMRR